MKPYLRYYFLVESPLVTLAGFGLLIMASSRLAFALITLGALVWVYGLSLPLAFITQKVFPQKGKTIVFLFLTSFVASIFLFLLFLISPLFAMRTQYLIILIPVVCVGSNLLKSFQKMLRKEVCTRALFEAFGLGLLIVAFALVREPFGYMTLSLPGGTWGIIELGYDWNFIIPMRIVSSSAGALILLGYAIALFQSIRKKHLRTKERP
ncbi:MAG: hypothetical protein LBK00_00360 [Treponema sp.]|jgi:hypothetical protein|nr:hypothetical protein [Treponema sp.]